MHQDSRTDPVTLDPDKFKIRMENERIRVLEASIPSGEGHGMHWHPEHLIYTLSSYKVRDTFPDGTTKTMARGAGQLLWGGELMTRPMATECESSSLLGFTKTSTLRTWAYRNW